MARLYPPKELPYARVKAPCPAWLTARKATGLIDRGDALWEKTPRKRYVVWREGDWQFRLSATNLRLLLDWKPASGRHGWQPGRCRYHG
jgi:hypothetical protein